MILNQVIVLKNCRTREKDDGKEGHGKEGHGKEGKTEIF